MKAGSTWPVSATSLARSSSESVMERRSVSEELVAASFCSRMERSSRQAANSTAGQRNAAARAQGHGEAARLLGATHLRRVNPNRQSHGAQGCSPAHLGPPLQARPRGHWPDRLLHCAIHSCCCKLGKVIGCGAARGAGAGDAWPSEVAVAVTDCVLGRISRGSPAQPGCCTGV